VKHPHAPCSVKLTILAALTLGAGATTAHAQVVEIREKEASSCFGGRTGDNPDPRSTCPDEKIVSTSRVISTMQIRPGQRARMTMQLRSYAACKGSYAIRYLGSKFTGWIFSYDNAPCQWDEDRTDFPVPVGPFPNGELLGKQLCAIWRIRNPTAKELRVSWRSAVVSAYMDVNRTSYMVIRNNIDDKIEPGIAETQRIETCLNPEQASGLSHRRWPSENGLHIEGRPPFPEAIPLPNGNTYLAYSWSYWEWVSGNYNTTPLDKRDAAAVAFYTDTMRDWALQSGETAGRYYVHLERAWIKDVERGTVVQVLK